MYCTECGLKLWTTDKGICPCCKKPEPEAAPVERCRCPSHVSLDMSLDEAEKRHILRVLQIHKGHKTNTAKELKITIRTLYNKLIYYGLHNPKETYDSSTY